MSFAYRMWSRSLDWYTGQLGLAPVRVDEWRAGQCPFPSVRVSQETIIDLIEGEVEQETEQP